MGPGRLLRLPCSSGKAGGKGNCGSSMSDTSPREIRAEDVHIVETREEIRLCFGAGGPAAGQVEPDFHTASQIILTPPAAKRLSQVLSQVLARHESLHGPLAAPRQQSRPPRVPGQPFPSAAPPSGVDCLTRLVNGLGVFHEREYSFKVIPGAILGDRILLGFNHDDLGGDEAAASLPGICRDLGMPDRFLRIYQERLPEANIILFGYEGHDQGGTWKAYLEFSGDYVTVARKPGQPASALLHLGFKWAADDSGKAALARYFGYPELTVPEMLQRVAERFYGDGDPSSYEIVRGMVDRAADEMPPDEILYLEVEEEGNPRRSYDINLYRAGLPLREFYSSLREACRVKGIGPETFHRLYEPMKDKIFGHVSGGRDREGRDFLTFYYGVAGRSR